MAKANKFVTMLSALIKYVNCILWAFESLITMLKCCIDLSRNLFLSIHQIITKSIWHVDYPKLIARLYEL